MSKNVLFSLKICKNRQTLGVLPPDPLASASGGSAPRPPHQSPYIVNSSLCICSQITDFYGIKQKTLFSCNYSRSVPGIRRWKKNSVFRMPQTTEFITIGFKIFRFVSPPPLIMRWRRPWMQHIKIAVLKEIYTKICVIFGKKAVKIAESLRAPVVKSPLDSSVWSWAPDQRWP